MKEQNLARDLLESFQKIAKLSKQNNEVLDKMSFGEMKLCAIIEEYNSQNQEITPIELAQELQMSAPAVNKTLNHLEAKKITERYRKEGDRKRVYVRLSESAVLFVKGEKEKIVLFAEQIVEEMGTEETKQLIELFSKLSKIMEKIHKGEENVTTKTN